MTSFLATHDFEMNVSHLDDKMEVGTSPYPTMDDIDFDFEPDRLEPDRQLSVDRSMADDAEALANNAETIHADLDSIYNDDDMLDDETIGQTFDNNVIDMSMEQDEGEGETILQQDDEILYDDDDDDDEGDAESVNMAEQHEIANVEDPATQQESKEEPSTAEENLEQEDNESHNHSSTNIVTESSEMFEQQRTSENAITEQSEQAEERNHETDKVPVVEFAEDATTSEPTATGVESLETDLLDLNSGKELAEHSPKQAPVPTPPHLPTEGDAVQKGVSQNKEPDISKQADFAVVKSATEPLHPITVLYLGQEMSFFPPMMEDSSATFFLSESRLAYEPVERLLASCREILGETLEHDDELVLDVPALGLHICEDSKYASQITLSQVADVYVSLSRNEHVDEIEPLYCSLSSRVCLSSQYAYLAASAAEGKTYSEIAADYVESPEHEANTVQEVVEADNSNAHDQSNDLYDQAEPTTDVSDVQPRQNVQADFDELAHDSKISPADVKPELATTNTPNAAANESSEVVQDGAEDIDTFTIEDHPLIEDPKSQPTEDLPEDSVENNEAEQFNIGDDIGTYDGTNESVEHEDDDSGSSHTVEAEDIIGSTDKSQHDVEDSNPSYLDKEPKGEELSTDFDDDKVTEGAFGEVEFKENETGSQSALNGRSRDAASVNSETGKDKDLAQAESIAAVDDTFAFGEEEEDEDDEEDAALVETQTENADEVDLLQVEDLFAASAPITPSKQNGNKRKVLDDEEDLDFLDFSTPEPKRTRAS